MPNTNGSTPLKRFLVKYRVGPNWTDSKIYLAVDAMGALEAFDQEFGEFSTEAETSYVIQLD